MELEENISAEHGNVISQLPDLVQERIFSFLGVRDKVEAAQVCSSWQKVVYRPCQWKEMKVRVDLCKLSEEALSSLKERGVRHLKVGHFCVDSNTLDVLRDCLVSLDLSKKPLPLCELHRMFCKSFTSLKKLCVFVQCEQLHVFYKVQHIFQHLSNVENLDMVVANCGDDVVQGVARCLKRLKRFSLRGYGNISCKLEFLSHLSCLQSLNLEDLTLQGIDCLKLSCKSLKRVSLKWVHFDSDTWPEVLCQLSSLEELEVGHCTPGVEDGLRQLAVGRRNLKVLMYDVFFFPPFDLDLWSLADMPNLETLGVSNCCLPNDADLRALSCGLKNLKSLAINDFDNFSVAIMKGIAGLSSLQELSLMKVRDLNGTTLEILSRGSSQLRRLELVNCHAIEGEDMKHVAGMSSLRDLTLWNLNLGSTGVNCLKQGTLRLEALSIKDCGFNFWDMKPWLEKQWSLQWLRLGSRRMSEAEEIEAQNLKNVLPSLRRVVFTAFCT